MSAGNGAHGPRLDPERENFLAAHAWCDHTKDGAALGLRLVFSLHVYLKRSGLKALGYRLTVEALTRPGTQGRNLARCRALWAVGSFAYFVGRYAEASDYMKSSLTMAHEMGDRKRAAAALLSLGHVAHAQGNLATAQRHLQEALALSRQLADKRQISLVLTGLAELHRVEGEWNKVEPLYQEALALNRELGDHGNIAINRANLAWTSISLRLGERARGMTREGFAIAEAIGSKRAGLVLMDCVTALAAVCSEWEGAARLYGAAEALSQQMGNQREPSEEASLAPQIVRTREGLGAEAFAAAESAGCSLSYEQAIAEARFRLEQRA